MLIQCREGTTQKARIYREARGIQFGLGHGRSGARSRGYGSRTTRLSRMKKRLGNRAGQRGESDAGPCDHHGPTVSLEGEFCHAWMMVISDCK